MVMCVSGTPPARLRSLSAGRRGEDSNVDLCVSAIETVSPHNPSTFEEASGQSASPDAGYPDSGAVLAAAVLVGEKHAGEYRGDAVGSGADAHAGGLGEAAEVDASLVSLQSEASRPDAHCCVLPYGGAGAEARLGSGDADEGRPAGGDGSGAFRAALLDSKRRCERSSLRDDLDQDERSHDGRERGGNLWKQGVPPLGDLRLAPPVRAWLIPARMV